jgi:hypothetical protein
VRLAGFTDRTASESLGRHVKRLADCTAMREPLPADLAAWIEGLPGRLRDALAKFNLLAGARIAAGKPLPEHLADFAAPGRGGFERQRTRPSAATGPDLTSWPSTMRITT